MQLRRECSPAAAPPPPYVQCPTDCTLNAQHCRQRLEHTQKIAHHRSQIPRCSFAVSAEGSKIGKATLRNSLGFEAAQQVRLHDIPQHPHQNKIIRLDVVHIISSAMLVSTALADHCVSMRLLSTTLKQLHFAHHLALQSGVEEHQVRRQIARCIHL